MRVHHLIERSSCLHQSLMQMLWASTREMMNERHVRVSTFSIKPTTGSAHCKSSTTMQIEMNCDTWACPCLCQTRWKELRKNKILDASQNSGVALGSQPGDKVAQILPLVISESRHAYRLYCVSRQERGDSASQSYNQMINLLIILIAPDIE
jgi:hypothetical protein